MPNKTIRIVPEMEIPGFLTEEIRAKLAYVDEGVVKAEVAEGREGIVLTLRQSPASGGGEALNEKVNRVVTAMVDGAFEPELRIIEDKMDQPVHFDEDPMTHLAAHREVIMEGPGYYSLGPLLSVLIDYFEERYRAVADGMGARPYRFPALISPAYLEKVKYLENFPHSLSFVTHLREDLEVIERFSREACCENGVVITDDDAYARAQAMLSPTVCHHLYMALADSTVPEEGIVATAFGNCFRYESSNMASLERLWNFSMREIIFIGAPNFVEDGLDCARVQLNAILDDMGLAYRIETATDPFFIGNYRDQAAYQSAFELKFEVRLALPYKNGTLAAGSYNRHRDFFGRTLDIRLPDGEPTETGCVGFGVERLAFAFVAQHGPDPEKWPTPVRAYFEAASAKWHSRATPSFNGPPPL